MVRSAAGAALKHTDSKANNVIARRKATRRAPGRRSAGSIEPGMKGKDKYKIQPPQSDSATANRG